ncbi:MAG: dephospho-CoA kinase [Planctomycetes bacterium]|nr:dephospho-CoA kinase [Planctomycetota bacterium]
MAKKKQSGSTRKGSKPVFGLVGGVAAGKSTVARAFEKRGAVVIDSDATGHEVLRDPQVKAELVQAFGPQVIGPDGEVDRGKVGQAVFGDAAKLQVLNGITHPRIRDRSEALRLAAMADPKVTAVVLDVSLLLEVKFYDDKYDVLVYIDTPWAVREQRSRMQRGWPQGEVARRQAHQVPLEEKRRLADEVIDNNGSEAHTDAQVETIWRKYVK